MKINRENVKWCARVMAIILAASVADALVVMFMRRPFPWTVIIPAFIPVLVAALVIVPMNRTAKR